LEVINLSSPANKEKVDGKLERADFAVALPTSTSAERLPNTKVIIQRPNDTLLWTGPICYTHTSEFTAILDLVEKGRLRVVKDRNGVFNNLDLKERTNA